MICRLLKQIILTVIMAVGLSACIPEGTSDSGIGASNAINGNQSNYSHHSYNHGSANGVNISTNIIDPPPDFTQAPGTGGSLWVRLRTNFQLPTGANKPQVQAQINWLMHNQGYLDRTIRRAAPYMYLIFQETQSRNLPGELVLLPIMESAYNPFIRSNRGAVGLWQLMSGTASGFGVRQDFWYDGRRDVYASTNAALDYLTYLQSYFGGDWLLAIAAYDAGEGRLQSAVRHNAERGLSTDFWSLSLPVETQAYVPRLLALAAIISNPAKYHVTLPPITDQPYLQQVDLGAPINLSQAAQMAGMSLDQLKALNPGYSRTTTGPNGPYRLLLPIDRIPQFKERLAALPAMTKTTWGRYKVQRGDTWDSIADRFDTTVAELRNVNHLHSSHVPAGRVIMIPTGTQQVTAHIYDLATGQKTPITADNVVDQAANVSASQAPVMNNNSSNLSNNSSTAKTVVTNTPANSVAPTAATSASNDQADEDDATSDEDTSADQEQTPVAVKAESAKIYHTIKHGETLSGIARRYGVKVTDIQRWNKLKSGKALKLGARLIIYRQSAGSDEQESAKPEKAKSIRTSAVTETAVSSSALSDYTVRSGDTLLKISRQQGISVDELRKLNRLKSNNLRNGQILKVPHGNVSEENTTAAIDDEAVTSTTSSSKKVLAQSVSATKNSNKSSGVIEHRSSSKIVRYTVRSGDNLIKIANRYNVKVVSLQKWNRLADSAIVKPGQKLVIYTEG